MNMLVAVDVHQVSYHFAGEVDLRLRLIDLQARVFRALSVCGPERRFPVFAML